MSITLHIDRLILDEAVVASHGPERIGAAIRVELERLLASDGLASDLASGGARARLSAGDIRLVSGAGPDAIGARVGQAIHGVLHSPGVDRSGPTAPPRA